MPITRSTPKNLRTLLTAYSSILLSLVAFNHSQAQDQEWPTYGGDLASTRYSPLDTINGENFNELELVPKEKLFALIEIYSCLKDLCEKLQETYITCSYNLAA